MKKLFIPTAIVLLAMLLFGGCVASVGSGSRTVETKPTLGQQLTDLQKAKASGALTDAEFETQKAKLLEAK
jgi:PBP1b-binding outer membrane lipoprotein LpoB